MDKKDTIRIELTDDQKKQIKAASGRDVQALELTAEELEERIAPGLRLSNSNETLLTC
jgi:hypothetical protein